MPTNAGSGTPGGSGPALPARQGLRSSTSKAQGILGRGRRPAMGLRLTLLLVVLVPLTIGLALVGGTVSLLLAQAVPSWLNE